MTQTASSKKVLTLVRTLQVPAQPAVTTSKQYFREAGFRLSEYDFQSWFSRFLGLEIEATKATGLIVHKVTKASRDAPILTELGNKAEVSISQFCAFLMANRENPTCFLSHLRGKDGNLWRVYAYWDSEDDEGYGDCGGWGAIVSPLIYPGCPRCWWEGGQVVSLC